MIDDDQQYLSADLPALCPTNTKRRKEFTPEPTSYYIRIDARLHTAMPCACNQTDHDHHDIVNYKTRTAFAASNTYVRK